jgi:hypothetical protein
MIPPRRTRFVPVIPVFFSNLGRGRAGMEVLEEEK